MDPCTKAVEIEHIAVLLDLVSRHTEKINVAISGDSNGNKGLVRRVDDIDKRLQIMEEDDVKAEKRSWGLLMLLVGNILALTFVGLGELIPWLIKTI